LVALACAVWFCLPCIAQAADPPRILLFRSSNAEPQMARRLHAEFTSLGISVVETADDVGDDPATFLSQAAAREHAFAAILVISDERGVTVWVADRLTDKILLRTLQRSRTEVSGEVLALEVVELLRASLLELNLPDVDRPPARPEVEALLVRPETRPAAEPSPHVAAEISGIVLAGPGGVSPTGHASVGIRYRWTPRISSRAFLVLPVVPGSVRGQEGRAEVGVALAGVGLDIALTRRSSNWTIAVGGAVAMAQLRTVGTSESALLERVDTVYAAVPAAVATLERRLSQRASIGLRFLTGASFPRPVILFADREVAHWGRPLVGASLALDIALD